MVLPASDVVRVQQWCEAQVPDDHRDRMRIVAEVGPRHLTILEQHPPWDGLRGSTSSPVARLRWTQSTQEWSLWCVDGNGRFRAYDLARPSRNVVPLLAVVEQDETAVFWG